MNALGLAARISLHNFSTYYSRLILCETTALICCIISHQTTALMCCNIVTNYCIEVLYNIATTVVFKADMVYIVTC